MTYETAKNCIDWVFENVPEGKDNIQFNFIGGEAFLEYKLIKDVIKYIQTKQCKIPYSFFIMTNGTLLNEEMKEWIFANRHWLQLGLSLDGNKDTHNHNRSNSFENIDLDFFVNTWNPASVKMTLTEYSLHNLASDIKFLHSKGFGIYGVNLFEGDFDWSKDEYIKILVPQLKELVDFYVENNTLELCQLFGNSLQNCELLSKQLKKTCGMGHEKLFFDVDGKLYPCAFSSPMTFTNDELDNLSKLDFTDKRNFNDQYCIDHCYIHPICTCCYGENYKLYHLLNERNKSKCRIHKLVALFTADLHSKRILKDRNQYNDDTLYYLIESIKKIRYNFLDEFKNFL